MKTRINAADVIALVTILGCFGLIAIDKSPATASTLLISIIAFYFGKKSNEHVGNGSNGGGQGGSGSRP